MTQPKWLAAAIAAIVGVSAVAGLAIGLAVGSDSPAIADGASGICYIAPAPSQSSSFPALSTCDTNGNLRASMQGAGANGSAPIVSCDQSTPINVAAAGTTQLVAAVAGKKVYVCGFVAIVSSGTSATVQLIAGTGTNCATITQTFTGPLQPSVGAPLDSGSGTVGVDFTSPASSALCIVAGGTTPAIAGFVDYTQF